MDIVDLVLTLQPVPGLAVVFRTFRTFYNTVESAKCTKTRLRYLRECIADLLLGLHQSGSRIESSGSAQAKDQLIRLMHEASAFVVKQSSLNFMRSLMNIEERTIAIDGYHRRLNTCVQAFQTVTLINVETHMADIGEWQQRMEIGRREERSMLHRQMEDLQSNVHRLFETLEVREDNVKTTMCALGNLKRGNKALPDEEKEFITSTLDVLSSYSGQPVEELDYEWTNITRLELEFGPVLGRGGFGIVCKGSWCGQPVAVKTFAVDGVAPPQLQHMEREAKILSKLNHDHIIAFLGANILDNDPFIVMPFFKNGNARTFVERHPNISCLEIIRDACKGLEYLHEMNVVHGDIKGSNILIDDDGRAVLCDFGLARVKADVTSRTGSQGLNGLVGSRNWMAPERLMGRPLQTPADIYSIGMTLYELLTLETPLPDVAPTEFTRLVFDNGLRPVRPTARQAPQLTDGIWALVEICWQSDPLRRPTADVVVSMAEGLAPPRQATRRVASNGSLAAGTALPPSPFGSGHQSGSSGSGMRRMGSRQSIREEGTHLGEPSPPMGLYHQDVVVSPVAISPTNVFADSGTDPHFEMASSSNARGQHERSGSQPSIHVQRPQESPRPPPVQLEQPPPPANRRGATPSPAPALVATLAPEPEEEMMVEIERPSSEEPPASEDEAEAEAQAAPPEVRQMSPDERLAHALGRLRPIIDDACREFKLVDDHRFAEAETYSRRIVSATTELFGDGHFLTRYAKRTMARSLYGQTDAKRQEAIALLRELAVPGKVDDGSEEWIHNCLKSAVQSAEDDNGRNDPITLEAVYYLALSHWHRRSYAEALTCAQRAYEGFVGHFEEFHTATLRKEVFLAEINRAQEEHELCNAHLDRAIQCYGVQLGEDHWVTLETLMLRADGYIREKKNVEAGELFNRCIAGFGASLGETHPFTVRALMRQGLNLFDQRLPAEAEPFLSRCQPLLAEQRGYLSTSTLDVTQRLGICYESSHRNEEAIVLYSKAVTGHDNAVREGGSANLFVIEIVYSFASLLEAAGKYSDVLPLQQRVLIYEQGRPNPDYDKIHTAAMAVVVCHKALHELDDAVTVLQSLLDRCKVVKGENSATAISISSQLADIYFEMGRPELAWLLYESCVSQQLRTLGPGHAETSTSMFKLAKCLRDLEEYNRADDLLCEVLAERIVLYGEDDPRVAEVQAELRALSKVGYRY